MPKSAASLKNLERARVPLLGVFCCVWSFPIVPEAQRVPSSRGAGMSDVRRPMTFRQRMGPTDQSTR